MADEERESWMSLRSTDEQPDGTEQSLARVDTTVAHPARRYDYWLGGKDNFAADRESGDAIAAAFPTVRIAVIENRRFVRRAAAFLAADAGIRQFLDIGTGIPTSPNVHEIAQKIDPASRVAYIDNDPIVLVHARALLTSSAEGATAYIDADLREPDKILAHPDLCATLDFSRPMALMLGAILHFIPDAEDPYGIVARLVSALPKGSYLVVSHATNDFLSPQEVDEIVAGRYGPFYARSEAEFGRFFEGTELVPPGITSVAEWRAHNEPQPRPTAAEAYTYCAVARVNRA
ncbi:MAG TPA: SAM-dependent methyltransferase [Trebonia sp.]|nr:SAM-dependent methyltransferase [Trebonia sp.]